MAQQQIFDLDGDGFNSELTLRKAGLRPTIQRRFIAKLLFSGDHRHINAEDIHAEAIKLNFPLSLATVYNTLNQFTEAGLLREIVIDSNRTYFDTNLHEHHHFFIEEEEKLVDIPASEIEISNLPAPIAGMEIAKVEVMLRLRKKETVSS